MTRYNGKVFANILAAYVRHKLESTHRGALLIRCVGDDRVVAAVFGNDNYLSTPSTRAEVELVRQRVRQAGIEELGFGTSHDGRSWALLVQADSRQYQTALGRALQMELLKIFLEDAVQRASLAAGTAAAEESEAVGAWQTVA